MSTEAKGPRHSKSAGGDAAEIRSTEPQVAISDPDRRERGKLLEVLAEAFLDNPMNVAIHRGAAQHRLRANRAGLRALVLRPADSAVLRVARVDGRIAGGFVAIRPRFYPHWRTSLRDQIGCFIHQGWRAMARWGHVNRVLALARPRDRHWYLAVLGVSPSEWRRGLGTLLIRELEALVSEEPASVYLESDRADSIRFYQRRGFEIREEHEVLGVRCACLELHATLPFRGV
jgi:ribosomal protein S18 acetylase RimI-like enzyme